MNKLLGLLFTCILSQTTRADITSVLEMLPTSKKSLALNALKILPNQQKQGVTDYLSVIGVISDGQMNRGMAGFNSHILKDNQCFNDLAGKFYSEINRKDFQLMVENKIPINSLGATSFSDKTSEIGEKPGWLWEKALAATSGDKLLAMQLIGICGHDNRLQVLVAMSNAKVADKAVSPEKRAEVEVQAKKMWAQFPKKVKDDDGDPEGVLKLIAKVDHSEGVPCPERFSSMYYPEALGAGVDIPENLKKRITEIQAPTKGRSVIPAKNYHVIGAAYTSCFLIRRNVPDFISKKMVMGAINVYRSKRICDKFDESQKQVGSTQSLKEILEDVKMIKVDPKKCGGTGTGSGTQGSPGQVRPNCHLKTLLADALLEDKDVTDEIIERKVRRRVSELDAEKMFAQSEYYRSANKCQGEQLGSDVRDFLAENAFSKNAGACKPNLSEDRCIAARKVIDTYLVDFEWSEAQHLAGYEFAKKNCPTLEQGSDINTRACKALGVSSNAAPQATPSPDKAPAVN